MKTLIIAVAFLFPLLSGAVSASEVTWLSLKEGSERARAEKKPMVVDFYYGKGCPRCEVIERTLYDNPSIAKKVTKEFIPVRVDLTAKLSREEEALGLRHDYRNDCLLLILDYKGEVIRDPSGTKYCFAETIPPDWFTSYLDMAKAVNSLR